ncbi:MAG TPA: SsrA-binding protein SmpB [Planctomycetota bacterium]|nr:SsrA-binding protein SmpB [Planctomycetota bacterium]
MAKKSMPTAAPPGAPKAAVHNPEAKGKKSDRDAIKLVAKNRQAFFKYSVEMAVECGMMLAGSEVKSLRAGQVNFADSYARVTNGEVWLHNLNIPEFKEAHYRNHIPDSVRKLLLRRGEIAKLEGHLRQKGYTLVPLQIYFKGPWAKVELGLCRGKQTHDKRKAIMDRDNKRSLAQAKSRRR